MTWHTVIEILCISTKLQRYALESCSRVISDHDLPLTLTFYLLLVKKTFYLLLVKKYQGDLLEFKGNTLVQGYPKKPQ